MQLPEILGPNQEENAAKIVERYYKDRFKFDQPRTGSRFDDWAGGGDALEVRNRITADDLVAVSFLSVKVPGVAAIGLLETKTEEITKSLSAIPADLNLAELKREEFQEILGKGSPAHELWRLLRGSDSGRWGIGPTTASKIMARKRPNLIPIWDSVIGRVVGEQNADTQWADWHAVLSDGSGLPERLDAIRLAAGVDRHVSQLRILDVVLWMYGKGYAMPSPEERQPSA
jgi:hypothetical protein